MKCTQSGYKILIEMKLQVAAAAVLLVTLVDGQKWAWPDKKQHKIDGKVRFEDNQEDGSEDRNELQHDSLQADADTAGQFPSASYGRRASYTERRPSSQDWLNGYVKGAAPAQSCSCVHRGQCDRPGALATVHDSCKQGQYLCCYETPRNQKIVHGDSQQPQAFNYYQNPVQNPGYSTQLASMGPEGSTRTIGKLRGPYNLGNIGLNAAISELLIGPGGPTGIIGPTNRPERPVLVGPGGPTGIIGPKPSNRRPNNGILVGPGGFTGTTGPTNRPILVGPGGPTGILGPNVGFNYPSKDVLVGPEGPTGVIGPNQRPVLVGPEGPTGIVGPSSGFRRPNSQVLVGPGGPTGIIGPLNRPVLVGPGGPTGIIGPRFRQGFTRKRRNVGQVGPPVSIAPASVIKTSQSGGFFGHGGVSAITGSESKRHYNGDSFI